VLVLFIVTFILWVACLGKNSRKAGVIILPIVWVFSIVAAVVFCILSLISCCNVNKNIVVESDLNKAIINQTEGIENFINVWNNQYFLPNGLYIIVPKNLQYVQIVLDSKIRFSLEDHMYPADLRPRHFYPLNKQNV